MAHRSAARSSTIASSSSATIRASRQLIGVTRISTIPTLNERKGIFTGVSKIYNPKTTTVVNGVNVRQEFPNDVINIPFDPAAVALLARFPTPTNLNAAANNYTRTANDADHQNQFDLRIDGALHGNDRAFGRYSYYNEVEQPVTPLPDGSGAITGAVIGTGGVAGLSNVLGQQAVFNETHTFSPHLLNDFRIGYTRRGNTITGTTLTDTASSALGIPGIPTNAAFNNALPLFTFTGFQQLGPSASTFSQYQTAVWQILDTVDIHPRPSHLQGGSRPPLVPAQRHLAPQSYRLLRLHHHRHEPARHHQQRQRHRQLPARPGRYLPDRSAGKPDPPPRSHRGVLRAGRLEAHRSPHRSTSARAGPSTSPPPKRTNQGAVFNLATQQLDYLGVNGFSQERARTPSRQRRAARRIRLHADAQDRRPLRLRHRLHRSIRHHHALHDAAIPLHSERAAKDPGQCERRLRPLEWTLRRPHSFQRPTPASARVSIPPIVRRALDTRSNGTLRFNASSRNNLSIEVAYVGSHIVHVGIPDSNLNQLTAAQLAEGAPLLAKVPNPYYGQLPISSSIGGKTTTAAQLLKPYPRFLNVATYRNNSGETNYNAGEVKVEQRLDHGLSFLFAYTHSRLIDDASSVFSTTVLSSPNSSSLIAADTFRPSLERDSSSGDMPNVTSLSAIYDLPAGHGHSLASTGIADVLLGGWQLNTIVSVQSGMPVTVTQATNNNAFAGFALQRPNLVGKPNLSPDRRTPAHFINTTAFATAPQFVIGTASRNPVRGPAYRDVDFALVKHTKIFGETELDFRAELFDVSNTPEFAQPNGSFGSAAFGSITSTFTDPRVAQLSIRVSR